MVYVPALWLPIVVSAVIVFVASSLVHMVLRWHRSDYQKLPNEAAVLAAMRQAGVGPGNYVFPHALSAKECSKPEMLEKFKQGPVGMANVNPSGPPAMGKYLAMWFAYCLLVSLFVAYLTGRTLAPGVDYLAVFRVAGCSSFLAYGLANIVDSIWRGQRWGATFKHVADGLIYSLLTAGAFGWLWPA